MELRSHQLSSYLLVLVILAPSSNASKVIDVGGKTLSRGTDRGMAYAKFKVHQFSYLNITNIGSDFVLKGSECGLACVNIPSCFSFNLATFSDVMSGKVICELLPSDVYNNSRKLVTSQFHHHYSIASPCISWPCQNGATCAAHYEKNSYVCVCARGYTGKYCESVYSLDDSIILGSLDRNRYLRKLMSYLDPVLQSSNRSVFWRCWHANTDGWASTTFHSNCDGKGPTVTIIKVNDHIFGGYTNVSWNSSSGCSYSAAGKAFLFSLYNINGYAPVKLTQYDDLPQHAMYHCSSLGPTFGDIHISNDAINNNNSYTHCGHTYTAPPGHPRHSSCPFFAGSYWFSPTDIEVFYETLA